MWKYGPSTLLLRRSYAIRSGVKTGGYQIRSSRDKPIKFDRNLPQYSRKKAWEIAGEDKESWFKRKYAHVHAREKRERNEGTERRDPYGKREAYANKVKYKHDEERSQHERHVSQYKKRDDVSGLQVNPLMEYIYGTNCVMAALKNDKREYFNKLFFYGSLNPSIGKLVKDRDVTLEQTDKHRLNLLTNYGVHNNIVLETKPLQPMELSHLGPLDQESGIMSLQEIGFDNTSLIPHEIPYNNKSCPNKKYPLGLFLDEVTDPHNVGAIIRSAYFLGVDFIVMTRKNCAPLSPVVDKTSSGAMEYMPIYYVDKPLQFFTKSQSEGGWAFITSYLSAGGNVKGQKYMEGKILDKDDLKGKSNELPIMLVVGNEGEGVRTNLRMRSDFFVEIPFGRDPQTMDHVVDSLNVSVATALLINNVI
ncbi:hypothetical protein NCAS_0B01750 [Naumovozyma castellii]|uniref:rRNA methyltransferase 1, mitochondrial n=1 Tax=Naumovozyma castellii TaxID=27288 RepID=G0VBD3_NAUCA|nr:hypothetical protein NCAS_0B01750 [Naumovozyma castellii CBS 4309]CCC68259.1 hypothetical protein NCAS_0B01750 [Naumovozyma castellii CBS 4309]